MFEVMYPMRVRMRFELRHVLVRIPNAKSETMILSRVSYLIVGQTANFLPFWSREISLSLLGRCLGVRFTKDGAKEEVTMC